MHQTLLKIPNGLDYYCPDFDRFYCADHYEVTLILKKVVIMISPMATCPYDRHILDDSRDISVFLLDIQV